MTGSPRSCRGGWKTGARASTGALAAILLTIAPLSGQATVRADVEENFRREPQGLVLARVNAGAELSRLGVSGSWTEASLEGWVWTASLQTTDREGMDLTVSVAGGENLRAEPSGTIVARLEEGTLLEELESRPGWTRVRRTGWIWSPSVTPASQGGQSSPGAAAGAGGPSTAGALAATPGADPARVFLRAGESAPILSAPDGDTIGTASVDGDLEVLAREGSWVRVRLDGWVWSPASDAGDAEPPPAGATADLTPDDLAAPDGASHEGRRVTWTVQFISLERAEAVRTDFYEGEPFILGRAGGAEGPFVYVAVPPDRLSTVEGLTPLELIRVTGRVRRASSALTGTPILDLLALERGAGG